jgi:hypothetical protein
MWVTQTLLTFETLTVMITRKESRLGDLATDEEILLEETAMEMSVNM